MPRDPFQLEQIQKWMQSVITHPEGVVAGVESPLAQGQIPVSPGGIEQVVERSKSLSSLERLQIYGNAYYTRLVECLRDEFPALAYALGPESFDAYAMGYLQSYPSQSYTLGQLGASFPRFLAELPPRSAEDQALPASFLVDLARLERNYSEVFDGPGSEGLSPLSPESLRAIPSEAWPEVKLVSVPSLRLARFGFPVHEYATSVRKEESPQTIPPPAETYLAINRREFIVRRASLNALQYELLGHLVAGAPLGQAISLAMENIEADVDELAGGLQAWFQEWTAWQFFASVEHPED